MADRTIRLIILTFILSLITSGCAKRPISGRVVECIDQNMTLTLASDWEGEVIDTDWVAYKRILKGREDFMWVLPPITARDIPVAEARDTRNFIDWRFKGVEGEFDETISPFSPDFPTPPGLWAMDTSKIQLLGDYNVTLTWPGVEGTQAVTRIYEHVRGMGDTTAIWHTYTVTFGYGPNTYEFVMLIPITENDQDYIDMFWASVENLEIGSG